MKNSRALDELGEPFPNIRACIAAGQSPAFLASSTAAALAEIHECENIAADFSSSLTAKKMKNTIHLSDSLALALHILQHPTPSRRLGDSFHAAHAAALASRAAGEYPREISATRGSRIAAAIIPPNMLAKMQASEARAWDHSPLAGMLWESGFRASRAIALADSSK